MKQIAILLVMLLAGCGNDAVPVGGGGGSADSSSIVVLLDGVRHSMARASASWDNQAGEMTLIAARARMPNDDEPPQARIVLKLKEKEGALNKENLERVTLEFDGFPNTGRSTMTSRLELDAVRSLSGGTARGDTIVLEYDWADAHGRECKGRMIVTLR